VRIDVEKMMAFFPHSRDIRRLFCMICIIIVT